MDNLFISNEEGFRLDRTCKDQVLALREYIKSEFESELVTEVVFIDLTEALTPLTTNHFWPKSSLNQGDTQYTAKLKILHQLEGKKKQIADLKVWTTPKGSQLASTLLNMYNNDQTIPNQTIHIIYADDSAKSIEDMDLDMDKWWKISQKKPSQSCPITIRNTS